MLTLLGIIFVVVKILESYPWEIRLISVLFLLFNPTHLLYLEKPMPDMVTELGFLLCFYSYYREKLQFEERQTNTNILFFFLGSVLIFLSKETFLIIYPFFLFWFMSVSYTHLDVYKRQEYLTTNQAVEGSNPSGVTFGIYITKRI